MRIGVQRKEIHFHLHHLCHARLIHIFAPQIRTFGKVVEWQQAPQTEQWLIYALAALQQ